MEQTYDETVEKCFLKAPFPERFNDHSLGVKMMSFIENDRPPQNNIEYFISQVNLGQKMVSKWFNRNKETGTFNMELIRERGFYNANQDAINLARSSLRGYSLLADAGENLIRNTYLIVNDIKYETKQKRKNVLDAILPIASTSLIDGIGGFNAIVTSYLFRLKWNDEIANEFYVKYYTEDGFSEQNKVKAYEAEKELFKMEYVGKTETEVSERQFKVAKKPEILLTKVLTRALDNNIAQLQHSYEDFRIKAPLKIEGNNILAYIGMKEDVNETSRYEVLDRIINKDGKLTYKRVGIITPVKGQIWDNRYMADEEPSNSDVKFTTFEKVSGGTFYSGMLIREISSK